MHCGVGLDLDWGDDRAEVTDMTKSDHGCPARQRELIRLRPKNKSD